MKKNKKLKKVIQRFIESLAEFIVGSFFSAADIGVKTYDRLKFSVKLMICACFVSIILLAICVYIRSYNLTLLFSVIASLVYLASWYAGTAFGNSLSDKAKEVSKAVKNFFYPIRTFSLMLAFTGCWISIKGFDSLTTSKFTVALTVVFFFTIFMIYNEKQNKIPGFLMFAAVILMLIQQAFPEPYRWIERSIYSSSQHAGSEADRYSINRQADARATYAYISEDGVLYDMQENETPMYVKTGQKVLILGIKNDLPEKETEPFVEIKLPNKHGAFVQSSTKYKYPRAKIGKFLIASDFDRREVPMELINLRKGDNKVFSLKEKESTPWIEVPTGVQYNIATPNNCPFRLRFWNGVVHDVRGINEAPFVSPCKFRIINMAGKEVLCQLNGL